MKRNHYKISEGSGIFQDTIQAVLNTLMLNNTTINDQILSWLKFGAEKLFRRLWTSFIYQRVFALQQ
jgi:hypothetical protein